MPRVICDKCLRPPKLCYCSIIRPIDNRIKVSIIQHPKETKHPFNTARIAQLCLNNSQLIVQEQLSNIQVENLLTTNSAILYPSMPWLPEVPQLVIENNLNGDTTKSGGTQIIDSVQQLIVLDATWRKSKRMMFHHEAFRQLPRICLTGNILTNYKVRKSNLENSLSSVESIYFVLKTLETNNNFENLLAAFNYMIETQVEYKKAITANKAPKTE